MPVSALSLIVESISVGKRLPDALYLHIEALPHIPDPARQRFKRACELARVGEGEFNVVRFARGEDRVSLLRYPRFFEDPFPVLEAAWTIDLGEGSVRETRYEKRANAPVLHRKESLLPPGHLRAEEFARLTAEAEALGLFSDAKSIGTRLAWEARLERLGVRFEGHRLVREHRVAEHDVVVHRHRTALTRYSLSTPMQALFRHGFLDGRFTVFDYGCGRGDDLRILEQLGLQVGGWDPHFAGERQKREADVVNLGFVINVIERLDERAAALRGAFALARRVLAVSALIGGRTAYEENRLLGDGVLTSRQTFQKYFQQAELRAYIETVLGREPIAIAPGLFFVFRDDDEEQNFLAARQVSARLTTRLPRREPVPRASRAPRSARRSPAPEVSKWELNRELIDAFWSRCLELARCPRPEEFTSWDELRQRVGPPKTVLRRLVQEAPDALAAARTAREESILVYLALNALERRRSQSRIAPTLRTDIAAFWGNASKAQEQARRLLFSIADTKAVHSACKAAASSGLGYLDAEDALFLLPAALPRVPPILRVYVQAGALLFGELDGVDVLKIHVHSGKLTLLRYDDFETKTFPRLRERIKLNLRRQSIDFFPAPQPDAQLCFPRSRLLPPDDPQRAEFVALEERLLAMGLVPAQHGCLASALEATLALHRVRIHEVEPRLVPIARPATRAPRT